MTRDEICLAEARTSQFVSRVSCLRFTHRFACCYNELALIGSTVKRGWADHVKVYSCVRELRIRCFGDEQTIFKQ
jgi:hypothetical protein